MLLVFFKLFCLPLLVDNSCLIFLILNLEAVWSSLFLQQRLMGYALNMTVFVLGLGGLKIKSHQIRFQSLIPKKILLESDEKTFF